MAFFLGLTGQNNKFDGGNENDTAIGQELADTLVGGFGNDNLTGNAGDDVLTGGFGYDNLSGGDGADKLQGGSGNDSISGGIGEDTISGGTGDDTVEAGSSFTDMANDVLDGGVVGGVDQTGVDKLIANFTGRDAKLVFAADDPINSVKIAGAFSFSGFEKYDVTGGGNDDKITGWVFEDILSGGAGDDSLSGAVGNDTLVGDVGKDLLTGGLGNDSMTGGFDNDVLKGGAGLDSMTGDDGADKIDGDADNDTIQGGAGADKLNGDDGDDGVDGGSENDKIDGGDGNDNVSGGVGSDDVSGGAGNDNVSGTAGYIDNDGFKDVLSGGAGDDTVLLGVKDNADGDGGADRAVLCFEGSASNETETLGSGKIAFKNGAVINGFESFEYRGGAGVDKITGGKLNDALTGNDGNDVLHGGKGADNLFGGNGDDQLFGEDGTDNFVADLGSDKLDGGADDDTFTAYYTSATDKDVYIGGDGFDTFNYISNQFSGLSAVLDLEKQSKNDGAFLNTTFKTIESFILGAVDDQLSGDGGANKFNGGDGDDVLDGRDGADILIGAGGADVMTGGAGKDVFDFAEFSFFGIQWRGDVITDFSHDDGDKLRVGFSGAIVDGKANLQLGKQATGDAATYLFDASTHRLWIDADGAGDSEKALIATLIGVDKLVANDFTLI